MAEDEFPKENPSDLGQQFEAATAPPPVPGELAPQEQRTMGMLCHLLSFAGLVGIPFGNILGPLVIWLIKKDEMPFVEDQGKESLNFQISLTVVIILLGILSLIPFLGCLFLLVLLGAGITGIVFVIIATIKASAGEYYRYPLNVRLIK